MGLNVLENKKGEIKMKISVKNEKILIETSRFVNIAKIENFLYEIKLKFLFVQPVLVGYEIVLRDAFDLRASHFEAIEKFFLENEK